MDFDQTHLCQNLTSAITFDFGQVTWLLWTSIFLSIKWAQGVQIFASISLLHRIVERLICVNMGKGVRTVAVA